MKYFLCVVMLLSISSSFFAEEVITQPDQRQFRLLVNNCMQCHAKPGIGAPIIGVKDDWVDIISQGEDTMLINVVEGIRGMPPLGYCSACSKNDLLILTQFISGLPVKSRSKK